MWEYVSVELAFFGRYTKFKKNRSECFCFIAALVCWNNFHAPTWHVDSFVEVEITELKVQLKVLTNHRVGYSLDQESVLHGLSVKTWTSTWRADVSTTAVGNTTAPNMHKLCIRKYVLFTFLPWSKLSITKFLSTIPVLKQIISQHKRGFHSQCRHLIFVINVMFV